MVDYDAVYKVLYDGIIAAIDDIETKNYSESPDDSDQSPSIGDGYYSAGWRYRQSSAPGVATVGVFHISSTSPGFVVISR